MGAAVFFIAVFNAAITALTGVVISLVRWNNLDFTQRLLFFCLLLFFYLFVPSCLRSSIVGLYVEKLAYCAGWI